LTTASFGLEFGQPSITLVSLFLLILSESCLGGQNQTSSEYRLGTCRIEHLSYLFAWLVGLLRRLKPLRSTDSTAEVKVSSTGKSFRNETLVELLRKCLLVSVIDNKMLMDSALHLAQLLGNTTLLEKLNKLSSIYLSNLDVNEENTSIMTSKNLLIRQEDSIREAAKKLELVKQKRMKSKIKTMSNGDMGALNTWVVAKSWNSCPIGMLPRDVGSYGCLPVLDYDDNKQAGPEPSERKEMCELKQCSGKREASCITELIDNSSVKKMKETQVGYDSDDEDVFPAGGAAKGRLRIGGVWKQVGEQELHAIESGVRILV
jgi:ribosomal biogenesis protein LAS1